MGDILLEARNKIADLDNEIITSLIGRAQFKLNPQVYAKVAVMQEYRDLLDQICEPGEDGKQVEAVQCDIRALKGITTRLRYGHYIAEAKFVANETEYSSLIDTHDTQGIRKLLVDLAQEQRVYQRITQTVNDLQSSEYLAGKNIVDPKIIVDFYKTFVIPSTTDTEVAYLMRKAAKK